VRYSRLSLYERGKLGDISSPFVTEILQIGKLPTTPLRVVTFHPIKVSRAINDIYLATLMGCANKIYLLSLEDFAKNRLRTANTTIKLRFALITQTLNLLTLTIVKVKNGNLTMILLANH
jgi:hypothetical protein